MWRGEGPDDLCLPILRIGIFTGIVQIGLPRGTRLLEASEQAARDAGFTRFEMGATLTGIPLYEARGYRAVERVEVQRRDARRREDGEVVDLGYKHPSARVGK